jgi:serine/threonine protein kinase
VNTVYVLAQTLHQLAEPDSYDEETLRNAESSLMVEASMLIRLKHPNIVQLMGIVMADDMLMHPKYLLMEPADLSLGRRLGQSKEIRLYGLWRLMVDLFSALAYMHAISAVHGDIKPDNVLLFNDDKGGHIAKLGDLGETNRAGAHAGGRTPFYSAPEILGVLDATLEPSCDVYSIGIVIAEVALQLLNSGPKCVDRGGIRACFSMSDFGGMIGTAIDLVHRPSWELGNVLRRCCERDPIARITSKEALVTLKSLKIEKYPPPPLWQLKQEGDFVVNSKDGSVALCRVDTCGNQLREHLIPPNFKKRKGFHGYCKLCCDELEASNARVEACTGPGGVAASGSDTPVPSSSPAMRRATVEPDIYSEDVSCPPATAPAAVCEGTEQSMVAVDPLIAADCVDGSSEFVA